MYKTIKKETLNNVQEITQKAAAHISTNIIQTLEVTHTFSNISEILLSKNQLTREMLNSMASNTMVNSPAIYGIGTNWEPNVIGGPDKNFIGQLCADKTGRFFNYTIRDEKGEAIISCGDYDFETDKSAEIWYKTPKKLGTQFVTNPYLYKVDDNLNVLMVTAISPVRHGSQYLGSIGADIKTDFLETITKEIKPYEEGYATIIANNGFYAANPDLKLINTPVSQDEFGETARKVLKEGKVATLETKSKGRTWYHTFQPIFIGNKNYPWIVTVSVPKDKIMAPADGGLKIAVFSGILGTLALAALVFWIGSQVSSRISRSMVEVKEHAEQTASTGKDIKISSDKLSIVALNQRDIVDKTARSMEEIKQTILESTVEAKNSQILTANITVKSQDGKKVMVRFTEAMDQISEVNSQLQIIVDIIGEIDKKTQIIHQIVAKTELLSLNASIEAARAGEFGKGFSVVAEEVANLAKTSGEAAKVIQELITQSNEKVQTILEMTVSRINQGKEVSQDVIRVFSEIDESIFSISKAIEKIVDYAHKQEEDIQKNRNYVLEIGDSAKTNSESAFQVADFSKRIQKESKMMEEITKEVSVYIFGYKESSSEDNTELERTSL